MPTAIEWTDESWNPIRATNRATGEVGHFCVHKSPGCINCYSETWQARFGNPVRFADQDREKVDLFLDQDRLHEPLGWRKPRRVFVCSMTDLFLENHRYDWLVDIWTNMGLARKHQFQVLTKRPEMMQTFLGHPKTVEAIRELYEAVGAGVTVEPWEWPFPNVWIGVSVEDQRRAAERIPVLLDTPAAVRFLSVEPLLEAVDLTRLEIVPDSHDERGELRRAGIRIDALRNIHCESGLGRGLGPINWVIVGGESGNGARPMHPQWARSIRDQCKAAGVPFFFKQWGSWAHAENEVHFMRSSRRALLTSTGATVRGHMGMEWDDREIAKMIDVGKKRAGRELDGRTWEEMPA